MLHWYEEQLICQECGETFERPLYLEPVGETFVCPACGEAILERLPRELGKVRPEESRTKDTSGRRQAA